MNQQWNAAGYMQPDVQGPQMGYGGPQMGYEGAQGDVSQNWGNLDPQQYWGNSYDCSHQEHQHVSGIF